MGSDGRAKVFESALNQVLDEEQFVSDPLHVFALWVGRHPHRVFLSVLGEGFEGVVLGGFNELSEFEFPILMDYFLYFLSLYGDGLLKQWHSTIKNLLLTSYYLSD